MSTYSVVHKTVTLVRLTFLGIFSFYPYLLILRDSPLSYNNSWPYQHLIIPEFSFNSPPHLVLSPLRNLPFFPLPPSLEICLIPKQHVKHLWAPTAHNQVYGYILFKVCFKWVIYITCKLFKNKGYIFYFFFILYGI